MSLWRNSLPAGLVAATALGMVLAALPAFAQAAEETSCGALEGASSCDGETAEPVSLLQVGKPSSPSLVARINHAPDSATRLELLKPLVWVHIAKTGSGILNTLYNHPGICPNTPDEAKYVAMNVEEGDFYELYPRGETCPGSFNLSYSGIGHLGFGPYFEGNEGHAIAMFRSPEQRGISAYHWSASNNFMNTPDYANATVKEYVVAQQGCQVKMLAEEGFPDGPSPCVASWTPPTDEMLRTVLYRLRRGFAFVGLTDEWSLSVCLFHAKFGGECTATEFQNTRPGTSTSGSRGYDTSVLEGWTDPWDRQVFNLAKTIFEEDLQRFGVSQESCKSSCYDPAKSGAPAWPVSVKRA